MRICEITCPLSDVTPEQTAIAAKVYLAALAEIGTNVEVVMWDEPSAGGPIFSGVRDADHHKARSLAYTAAGLPFEWVDP